MSPRRAGRRPAGLESVLGAIAATAARLCEATDTLIHLVDGANHRLVARYGRLAPHFQRIGATHPIRRDTPLGLAVLDRQLVHVGDIQTAARTRFGGLVKFGLLSPRIRTVLVLPLLRNGKALGGIVIRRTRVQPFTARQIALLRTFADQAAIAIENARLSESLATRNRELTEALERQTATAEILGIISESPTDLAPVLQAVAERAARLCDAADAVLYLKAGEVMRIAASHGTMPVANLPPGGLTLSRGYPSGRAVLDRRTVRVTDLAAEVQTEFPEARAVQAAAGTRSVVASPLLREGVPVGVFLIRRTELRPFSDSQIALLESFAAQAVIAIENVRLFTELQTRNRELSEALEQQTVTAEILGVISSSPTDVQPVLDMIASHAARASGGYDATVNLLENGIVRVAAHHGPIGISVPQTRPLDRTYASGRAIIDGQPFQIRDILASEADDFDQYRATARQTGYRTLVAVPMLREGAAIGALSIRRREAQPFTDKQIALLQTFADQAVIAIENVRLFTELGSRNRDLTDALDRQTATAEILQVISRSQTDVRPVFEAIADSALRLFRAWSVVVCRYDGERLHLEAASGGRPNSAEEIRDQFPTRPGHGSAIGTSILTRAVHHVGDAQASDQNPRLREVARARGFRSAVAAPMLRDGEPVGAIVVTRAEVRPFSEAEIELLRTFAAQAVIAIENVRLVSALQERNRALSEALEQQTATSEILRVISSSPTDTQPVFDAIIGNAVRLCGALYGAVWRYADGLVDFVSTHGIPPDQLDAIRRTFPRPIHEDPIQVSVTEGRAVYVPDIEAMPGSPLQVRPDTRDRWRARGVRSFLIVPMRRDAEVVGAITVTHREVGAFAPRRVELLKTFADQAVIAIENARLFGELQERTNELARSVDQLRALSEVGQAVSSTLDLDAVLQAIVTRASQLAGSRGCSIWEYDEQAEVFHLRATTILDAEIAAILRSAGLRKGVGAIGRAALTRAPVQIPDVSAAGAYEGPLRESLLRAGGGSVLTIPLLHEDRVLGGLTVSRRATGEFPPELVALLTTFAAQSAIALQNARLFRELEAKSRELEIASRHKSQFLANMSHELRTPLNAILGYGEMLADGIYGELPPTAREVLGRVDASGRHLLGLINDVLDLSKIEAGQLSLTLAEYSMQEVAQTVIVSVEALAAEKGLALALDIAPELPTGRGDQRRLTQVLLNLVGNAIKFTEQGGVGVQVAVADGAFEIAVRDTGPGIAAADHERIFEEFQQADTATTRPKGGTGLGLAIARRIVALHGGRLWVESTRGEGATFRITVPIRVERQIALAAEAAS